MFRKNKEFNKHQIISEYLTGNATYRQLGTKYKVPARTIQSWVRNFRKRTESSLPPQDDNAQVKQLQKQLEQSQLKNELLEEMLRQSETYTGLELRKKFGTKQS